MPFRLSAASVAILLTLLFVLPAANAGLFIDLAGRRVVLPDNIERIMAAGPASAVFVYVVVPDKLIGWSEPLTRAQRALLPSKYARLPVTGELGGAYPTATAADVLRLHPDLIIGYGVISPPTVALADRIQQQTHIPYILLDDSIQVMPAIVRQLSPILGAGDHGLAVGTYAFQVDQHLARTAADHFRRRPAASLLRSWPRRSGNGVAGLGLGQRTSSKWALSMSPALSVGMPSCRSRASRSSPGTRKSSSPSNAASTTRCCTIGNGAISPRCAAKRYISNRPTRLAGSTIRRDSIASSGFTGCRTCSTPISISRICAAVAREFYQLYYGVQLNDAQLNALLEPAENPAAASKEMANVPIFGAEPPPPLPNTGAPGTGMGPPPAGVPGRSGPRGGATQPQIPTPNLPTRPSPVSLDAKWLPLDVKQLDGAEADAILR